MPRVCRDCQEEKPDTAFTKSHGYLTKLCKSCAVVRTQRWVAKNAERRAQYERDYYASADGKKVRRAATDRYRETENGRQHRRSDARRYAKEHPEKVRARKLLGRAVASGLVTQGPCERCGSTPTDGHHDDYSKPLEVRWLCRACHGTHHTSVAKVSHDPPQ